MQTSVPTKISFPFPTTGWNTIMQNYQTKVICSAYVIYGGFWVNNFLQQWKRRLKFWQAPWLTFCAQTCGGGGNNSRRCRHSKGIGRPYLASSPHPADLPACQHRLPKFHPVHRHWLAHILQHQIPWTVCHLFWLHHLHLLERRKQGNIVISSSTLNKGKEDFSGFRFRGNTTGIDTIPDEIQYTLWKLQKEQAMLS